MRPAGTPRAPVAASVAALLLALVTSCTEVEGDPEGLGSRPPTPQPTTQTGEPATPDTEPTTEIRRPGRPRVVGTVARNLTAPWGVTFLPDGSALVGERDTRRVLAIPAGGGRPRALVYAYVSTAEDNRVVTMRYTDGTLGPPRPVLTGIPNGFIHDGGRLLFADDGTLFVSTGEIGEEQLAQDRSSLAGKVLHITADGEPAPDNPVEGSPVWSMGHRNVQGLAFDDRGRLWASEFGQNTWDELNQILKGRNYGWPIHEGRAEGESRYRDPFIQWRTSEASPSGLAFHQGSLWMASLQGERLWQVPVTDDGVGRARDWFVGDYGRMRTIVVAPNGNLWLTTSNRDGRGDPAAQDDRILEVAVR